MVNVANNVHLSLLSKLDLIPIPLVKFKGVTHLTPGLSRRDSPPGSRLFCIATSNMLSEISTAIFRAHASFPDLESIFAAPIIL
jgi:hypothetical protein